MVRCVRTPAIAKSMFSPNQLCGWSDKLGNIKVDSNSLFRRMKRRKAVSRFHKPSENHQPTFLSLGTVVSK